MTQAFKVAQNPDWNLQNEEVGSVMTVAFDTLKFAQTLRDKAKVPQDQAEGMAQAFADATGDQIATKSDLTATELRLQAEIKDAKFDILKWMVGMMGFQTIVIIGAVVTLIHFIH